MTDAPEAFDAFPPLELETVPDLGFWGNVDALPPAVEGPCPCGAAFVACICEGFPKTLCAGGCVYAWADTLGAVRPVHYGRQET